MPLTPPLAAAATLPTPKLESALEDKFQSEWSQAQDFYNRRLQAGDTDPNELDQLYLAPLRAKWGIVASSPELQTSREKFDSFDRSFQTGLDSFNAAAKRNEIGDSPKMAFNRTLQPVLEKQSVLNALGKNTQDDYEKALNSVLGGAELETLNFDRLKPSQVSSLMSAYRLKHPTHRKTLLETLLGDDAASLLTPASSTIPTPSTNKPGIKILSIKKVQ